MWSEGGANWPTDRTLLLSAVGIKSRRKRCRACLVRFRIDQSAPHTRLDDCYTFVRANGLALADAAPVVRYANLHYTPRTLIGARLGCEDDINPSCRSCERNARK